MILLYLTVGSKASYLNLFTSTMQTLNDIPITLQLIFVWDFLTLFNIWQNEVSLCCIITVIAHSCGAVGSLIAVSVIIALQPAPVSLNGV